MERVAQLVNESNFRQALVRLWLLAGRRVGAKFALNEWERGRETSAYATQVQNFITALQSEETISAERVVAAPLAFVEALDQTLALLHRAQPWSDTAFDEEGQRIWLVPVELGRRQQVPLARQSGNRESWFKWHTVMPAQTKQEIDVLVTRATGRLAAALAGLMTEEGVRLTVWIGHFVDAGRLEWDRSPSDRFRMRRIEPHQVRHDSIIGTLKRAADAGAHVVLLPEFTVDLDARRLIADWLVRNQDHPFAIVVAGSFHEETKQGWFNTAELWNYLSEPILSHRKLRLFGNADGLAEDVGMGRSISVLASPAGTFALLICKDFLDDHQMVATLLQEVPIDWVLVPSYGDETTVARHKRRALELARVGPGLSSIVANQRNVGIHEGPPCPGFAQSSAGDEVIGVGAEGGLVAMFSGRAIPQQSPPQEPRRIKRVK